MHIIIRDNVCIVHLKFLIIRGEGSNFKIVGQLHARINETKSKLEKFDLEVIHDLEPREHFGYEIIFSMSHIFLFFPEL